MKLPLGMMRTVGEAIGGELGEYMATEVDDDEMAVGRYLRIKAKLDITKPLMRGVTVFVGEREDKPLRCLVEYEFLPDFCYICGLIGHVDKACGMQLGKGEKLQFSKSLRCFPTRKRGADLTRETSGGGSFLPWRMGGSGSRNNIGGSGTSSSGRDGSDAPSWHKPEEEKVGGGPKGKNTAKEEEVTSPLKEPSSTRTGEEGGKTNPVCL